MLADAPEARTSAYDLTIVGGARKQSAVFSPPRSMCNGSLAIARSLELVSLSGGADTALASCRCRCNLNLRLSLRVACSFLLADTPLSAPTLCWGCFRSLQSGPCIRSVSSFVVPA